MTDVERFLAIEEIKQLKARYFRCVDTKDWDGFAALSRRTRGWTIRHQAVIRRTGRSQAPRISWHSCVKPSKVRSPCITATCPRSSLSHQPARGIFAMEDLIWWPEGRRHKTLHGWGHYQETYEKNDWKWVIKTLRLTRLRLEES
jgi:hypothetical protein